MEEVKAWYLSKTLWVNVLVLVGAFTTDFASVLGAEGTITVVAVLNLVLRVLTKHGIKLF